MKSHLLFSFISILTITCICQGSPDSSSKKSSYGEECSEFIKCDRKAWLSCQNGICVCANSEDMFYENEKRKCVTKPGERCRFGTDESEEDRNVVAMTECASNSECGRNGLCVCKKKYHEASNGTCILSKTFRETCSLDGELEKCSKSEKLSCLNGICTCDDESSIYSFVHNQCVGILHSNCIYGKCAVGVECIDGVCSCGSNYFEDISSKICILKKSANENCTEDSDCINQKNLMLKCVNGKCNCEQGLAFSRVKKTELYLDTRFAHTKFGKISARLSETNVDVCASLVGGKCPSGYCIENALCVIPEVFKNVSILPNQEISYDHAVCECDPHFVADKYNHKCRKGFSAICHSSQDCVNEFVCNEGKCACPSPSFQKYDSNIKACVTEVDGRCDADSKCVPNAFCNFIANSTVGHCQCLEGFVDNSTRGCELSYGSVCTYGSKLCDRKAALICLDGKCSCKDSMHVFSPERRECVGLVGAKCSTWSDGLKCITNAECGSKRYGSFHSSSSEKNFCKCKNGFQENSEYKCEAVYEAIAG